LIHKFPLVKFLLHYDNEPNPPPPQMILAKASREGREAGEGNLHSITEKNSCRIESFWRLQGELSCSI
jgi:hypothetical protein